ncbi:MAG: tetratricopeptide repeat protein [Candidatus Marinimicrobia bacterium]|nr:tetratricopeptide repeat protein [FCB group bacterium]MBL7025747.1 tetratricopeptide repeat protein [Candidatus Neomarinimicrobiota bacterium]
MGDTNLQSFLSAVHKLAVRRCGQDFADYLIRLRSERERLLKKSWKKTAPEELGSKTEIFREIDFDTIQLHSAKFLEERQYLGLLYEIAKIAIPYGQFHKAQQLLLLLKDHSALLKDDNFAVQVHQRLGDISFYLSDFNTSLTEYELCMDYYIKLKNPQLLAGVMLSISVVLVEKGEVDRAESLMQEAKALATEYQLNRKLIKINMNLGNIYHMKGSYDDSLSHLMQTLELLGDNDDHSIRARILHNIGLAYKAKHEDAKALENFNQSIELSTTAENNYMKSLTYLEKSEILYREDDLSAGTALATSAFQAFSQFGDRLSIGETYKILGMISGKRKNYRTAQAFLENSLRICRDHNKPLNVGQTQVELAHLFMEQGDTDKAIELLKDAKASFVDLHALARVSEVEGELSTLME